MTRALTIFLTALLFLIIGCSPQKRETVVLKTVQIEPILELDSLRPKVDVNQSLLYHVGNVLEIDDDKNLYFLDTPRHRIMKYTMGGKFVTQIGSIGQDDESLYYPSGIAIDLGILYILDQEGRRIKLFTLDGDFISGFQIHDAYGAESISVKDSKVFASVKYNNKESNQNKLVSVFNSEGNRIDEFLSLIETVSFPAHVMFNKVVLFSRDSAIYSGHKFFPILRRYDLKNRREWIKDLLEANIDEIHGIYEEGKRRSVDQPNSIKEEDGVFAMNYCTGLAVGVDGFIYYALNYDRSMKGMVLKFDTKGDLLEKMSFLYHDKLLSVRNLYMRGNDVYIIGGFNDTLYLFKI